MDGSKPPKSSTKIPRSFVMDDDEEAKLRMIEEKKQQIKRLTEEKKAHLEELERITKEKEMIKVSDFKIYIGSAKIFKLERIAPNV